MRKIKDALLDETIIPERVKDIHEGMIALMLRDIEEGLDLTKVTKAYATLTSPSFSIAKTAEMDNSMVMYLGPIMAMQALKDIYYTEAKDRYYDPLNVVIQDSYSFKAKGYYPETPNKAGMFGNISIELKMACHIFISRQALKEIKGDLKSLSNFLKTYNLFGE